MGHKLNHNRDIKMIKFNYIDNIPTLYDKDDGWTIEFENGVFNTYHEKFDMFTQSNYIELEETTDTLEEALEVVKEITSSFDDEPNYELAYDIQYTHINTQQI